jgi:hypothetical protein
MKKTLLIFILLLNFCMVASILQGQESTDTTRQGYSTMEPPKRDLPTIQLQDYTIVGLAEISLPHKVRPQIFQKVKISWSENEKIYEKEVPEISYQFSRIKPSLFRLYDFPWLDSRIHYGTYNTAGININMQFKAQNTLPYFMADFQRSDGHLENAQWTTAVLKAGIHQKMNDIHLLHLNTDYTLNKKGVWGYRDKYQEDWETTSTFWDIAGKLEDQWSDKLRTSLSGKYRLDEHKNAFKYSQQGYDLTAGGKIDLNNTKIHLEAEIQNSNLDVNDGNLTHLSQDSTGLRNYQASLLTANLSLQQNYKAVTADIGILFQQSEEEKVRSTSLKVKKQQFFPVVSLSAGFEGRGKIYARYRPGMEINFFRNSVKAIPFSEFSDMNILNYKARLEAGFDLQVPGGITLQLLGRYSEIEDYQAVAAPSDSLEAMFTETGYPGWIFSSLEKVEISEIFGKCDWNPRSNVSVLAWINWRMSDIRQTGEFSSSIVGNELPYLPAFTAYGGVRWNFYQRHELKIWTDYLGSRYDDLTNQVKVDGYALLNTSLQLNFGENYSFIISGQNLFDTHYEEFRGFTAPGITGWLGLRLMM